MGTKAAESELGATQQPGKQQHIVWCRSGCFPYWDGEGGCVSPDLCRKTHKSEIFMTLTKHSL